MKTETTTGSMTGSLDGSAISVSFNSSPLFFGRVDGDGFQVDVPQDSGGTAPLVLHRATTSAFNSEVTRLQSVADDANARENATEDRAWEQEPLCAKGDPFYLDCTWPDGRKETCNTLASGECPYPRREPGELPPSQRSR
jgi:hypothetical protein